MVEIWKDIKGFEGLYQVSNFGRVRSMKAWNSEKGMHLKHASINNKTGYPFVTLYDGKKKGLRSTTQVGRRSIHP